MTSNIGSDIIQEHFGHITDANYDHIVRKAKSEVFELLKKSVRPEFLNRVDDLIMFNPLTKEDIRKIVGIQFNLIKKRLDENGIKIETSDNVLDYLGEQGYDPQYGARPLKRVLQKTLLNKLSKEILAGNIKKDAVIGITLNERKEIEFFNLDKVEIESQKQD